MKRSLLLCISFIVFLTAPLLHAAEAAEPSDHGSTLQDILILNSYHPGYAWSDDEQAGIIDLFRAKDKNWLPVIEYLDLQRLPDGRHLAELKQLFRLKYQYKKFSVVIAMDNPALEFAMVNQAKLFRNAPIVFCGINNYTPSLLKGRSDVTGIAESLDIAGTIEVMLRLHPAAREIFVPHDYTVTGLAVRKEIEELVPRFSAKVRFRFADPLTMEELLKELERLPKDSLILEIGFITDKSYRTFGVTETTKLFYEHSPVPVYSTFEQRLGFGIVGGKLLSARIHGTNAARIALRVLAGEKASAIPIVFESDSQFMFDYKVMSHFGIPLSALPEGSTVINKPVSFYAAHRVVIQTALGIIGFLLIVTFLLTINIIQRRRSAIVLRASEESLSFKQAQLQAILDYSPALISVKDLIGNVILANRNFAVLDVPPLHEFVGKNVFDLFPRDVAENLWNNDLAALKAGGPVESEEIVKHKDGSWHTYLTVKFPVYKEPGQPFGICAISTDITERKEMEKALRDSEERYHELFDNISSGVAIYEVTNNGNDFIFKDFNRAGEQLDGDRKENIIGKSIYQVRPGINEYGLLEVFKRVWATGIPEHYPVKFYQDEQLQGWYDNFVYRLPSGEIVAVYDDITERKRAEEALRESEDRLRFHTDNSPMAVVEWNTDFIVTRWTGAAEKMFGWSFEETIGKPIMELRMIYEKDIPIVQSVMQRLTDGKSKYVVSSNRNYTKERQVIHCEWYNSVLHDSAGKMISVMSQVLDITDRKQAEEALRRAEENFRRSLDDAPLGVRIVTIEGETIYANRAILDIYGYDSIEKLNTTPVKKRYSPESYAEFQIRKEKREQGDDVPSKYEVSIVRKDGEVRQLQVFRKPTLWDGEKQFQVIYQDITERKQVEEELKKQENLLQRIFDVLPVGLWFADKNGKLLRGNLAGVKIWGAEPKVSLSEFGVFKARRLPSGEEIAAEDWALAHTVRERVTVVDEMLEIDAFDGKKKVILNYTAPVLDDQGAIQGAIVVNLDITDRKRAEEEIHASRKQMRALAGRLQAVREEERTQIAREIHDELGGALTGLKIDFSLLTRAALKIENQTVRASLLAGMNSMIKFIDATIHTVRRIAMELRPGILDDLGLVAALEWQLKDFEKRTGIRCEFFPPVEDISLDADLSTALFRIFQEALTNVARHSGATEVRVRLRADADSSTLEVEDNGKGIEKKKTLSSKSLGLLGMRERAQMFGGRITVTGTPGIGTKVTVEISPVEKRKMDRDQEGAAG